MRMTSTSAAEAASTGVARPVRPSLGASADRLLADITTWDPALSARSATDLTARLELGDILVLPNLPFALRSAEQGVRSCAPSGRKNISYDPQRGRLAGIDEHAPQRAALHTVMGRYAEAATTLVQGLLPQYATALEVGRGSCRPVEIAGRAASVKSDDTRLHVDAFPATPVQGRRLLRVFTNIDPDGTRHWRTGEPFATVAQRFAPRNGVSPRWRRRLLALLRLTKSHRTGYDEAMLRIHDTMKMDNAYQRSVAARDWHFAPGETWIVFSDLVSHAALSGRCALEQTFYVPVAAMQDPARSPLRQLEQLLGEKLLD